MIEQLPNRDFSQKLLYSYIESESLRQHSEMVATAMEAYAVKLGKSKRVTEYWWTAGLLHDLDWEKYPEEHPKKAVQEILPPLGYAIEVIAAIHAHAPERTGKEPESELERYLFACDEISGFMNAVALMRPNGFDDMKVKSVRKKLKDKRFAANVPREDIQKGAELIETDLSDHILFLIEVFSN
ncbi:MAG: HD domain-containing protein [Balneolaceae bacterium]|nr:MAG: HD domain-containing protein [Balneolaceae bacterium]